MCCAWPAEMAHIAAGLEAAGGLMAGGGSLFQAHDMYKGSMAQNKRYFAATWAEASWRHSESLHQAERHHLECAAFSQAALHQADKIHQREFRQAELQDQRNYLMTVNSEIREALREIVQAKSYEYNNIMLCDTVCIGCSFALVIEGIPPIEARNSLLTFYMSAIALSLAAFLVSLWSAVILARRLNRYTTVELTEIFWDKFPELVKKGGLVAVQDGTTDADLRKLGAKDRDAQINAFEKFVEKYIVTGHLGTQARTLMLGGVVFLFCSAVLLVHMRLSLTYEATSPWVSFTSIVGASVVAMLRLEINEYWMTTEQGNPFPWCGGNPENNVYALKKEREAKEISEDALKMENAITQELNKLKKQVTRGLPGANTNDYLDKMDEEEKEVEKHCPQIFSNNDRGGLSLESRVEKYREGQRAQARNRKLVAKLVTVDDKETDKVIGDEQAVAKIKAILTETDEGDDAIAENLLVSGGREADSEDDELADRQNSGAGRGWKVVRNSILSDGAEAKIALPNKDIRGPFDEVGSLVSESALYGLREQLGTYSRSTIVHIENHGDESLYLKPRSTGSSTPVGHWFEPNGSGKGWTHRGEKLYLTPPHTIEKNTKIVVAVHGTGVPRVSGAKIELMYQTKNKDFEVTLTSDNPILPGKRGRYCRAKPYNRDPDEGLLTPASSTETARSDGTLSTQHSTKRVQPKWWDVNVHTTKSDNNEIHFKLIQQHPDWALIKRKAAKEDNALVQEIKKFGTLLKAKRRLVTMVWLPRYFVLTLKHLRYYEDRPVEDGDGERPLGTIELSKISSVVSQGGGYFDVHAKRKDTSSKEPYRLCVDPGPSDTTLPGDIDQAVRAEKEAELWIAAIKDAMKQARRLKAKKKDFAAPDNVPVAATQAIGVLASASARSRLSSRDLESNLSPEPEPESEPEPEPEPEEEDGLLPRSRTSAQVGSAKPDIGRNDSTIGSRDRRVQNGSRTEFRSHDTDEINIIVERSQS
eukprot:COSAG02_NODE_663_length_18741_cov_9.083682_17_plen_986_part_00